MHQNEVSAQQRAGRLRHGGEDLLWRRLARDEQRHRPQRRVFVGQAPQRLAGLGGRARRRHPFREFLAALAEQRKPDGIARACSSAQE
jgi:hypothetical protein